MLQSGNAENNITNGVIWKALLSFFFPILLGTFFQQMYNTVDAIIVGKYVGKEALAAVGGATGNLVSLIVGFFVGLSSGATVVLSQFYGARKADDVSKTIHTSITFAMLCGIFLTVVGLCFSHVFLEWMGTPEEVMTYAVPYIRIYFAGMIPSMIYNIGSGLLRAAGDSRRPLLFLICACVSNIILDIVLVVGAEMGTAGAAIATIISQLVSAVLVIATLQRNNGMLRFSWKKIGLHKKILVDTLRIGFPAGIQSVLFSISNVLIQSCINSFGTNVIAAFSAHAKIDSFYWMILNAFSISLVTFVGQNFGANKMDRVKKSLKICTTITLITTVVYSVLLYFFGKYIFHLFTDDADVIQQGVVMLKIISAGYICYLGIAMLSSLMQGMGEVLVPTILMLFGICVLRILWVEFFIPTHHEISWLMFSYPMSWTFTSILFFIYYKKGKWMERVIGKNRFASQEEP